MCQQKQFIQTVTFMHLVYPFSFEPFGCKKKNCVAFCPRLASVEVQPYTNLGRLLGIHEVHFHQGCDEVADGKPLQHTQNAKGGHVIVAVTTETQNSNVLTF